MRLTISPPMKYWRILNAGLLILSAWVGYGRLSPEKLGQTNPDEFAFIAVLLASSLMPTFAVWYAIKTYPDGRFRRPSWDRAPVPLRAFPFNYWRDPLQTLFIVDLAFAASAIGGAVRMPSPFSVGFWTVGISCAFAVGLLIGQAITYRVFRARIVDVQSA